MRQTKINDPKWLDWHVGEGKQFETLEDLLQSLREIRALLGPFCGFAGGYIDEEIAIVEEMIEKQGDKP